MYPICLGDFRVVYKHLMTAVKVWGPGANPAPKCPAKAIDGTQYSTRVNHYGCPPPLDWMYHTGAK
jgi:hypothetical protein